MITTVTTHDIEIFKLFYTNKHHNILKENMIVYIDKYDSSEFRNIIGNDNVITFDKNDIKKYYSNYLEEYKYGAKVYFLNMLCETGLLNDSLYFTDDDVLIYNEKSFKTLTTSDKILHSTDIMHFDLYKSWPKVNNFIKENIKLDNILSPSTNVFIPKQYINEFSLRFTEVFKEFMPIICEYKNEFIKLDKKTKSERKVATITFYLDTPFFNCVYQRMQNVIFKKTPFHFATYNKLYKIKNKLNTNNTNDILNYFISNLKIYPKKQPIIHIYITNKQQLMKYLNNYLNNIHNNEDINELFKQDKLTFNKFYKKTNHGTKPLF